MEKTSEQAGSAPLQDGLVEATRLTEEGDWPAAFRALLELERDHPRDATLLCMLGVVAGEAGVPGMSYDFFRRCLALEPQDPHVLATLGAGLARYDDPEAESVLRLAAVTAPGVAAARLQYGSFLAREGMAQLALAELEAARELEPDDPVIARELGIARVLNGAPDRGAEALEEAVGLADDDAALRFLWALVLLQLHRFGEAAEELHRAAQDLSADGEVQLITSLACATQQWMDEAWSALARAEQAAAPPDPDWLQEAEAVLELDPDAAQALLDDEIVPAVLRERLMERP